MIDRRGKQAIAAETKKADIAKAAARRRADLGVAEDGRSQDRARLCAAAAGQRARRLRPPDRADQGAAPLAGDRDGLRHAGGAHPRQCAARRQHLHHQDQGGRSRHRQGVARPVHGHGPDRQPGDAARHPHHRADLRPAGDLDRSPRSRKRPRSRATPWSMPRPCWRRI